MLLGPIFTAELRTAARRKRYYLLRTVYAASLLFILWSSFESAFYNERIISTANLSQFARAFTRSFALLQGCAILLIAPAMFAGAIAQDRERRTIDYLLTSELGSSDIVLGKLGARTIQALILLGTGGGFLSISLLFGGVELQNLLLLTLAASLLLFECGAVSILISTWTRRSRHALRNAYIVIAVWAFAPIFALEFARVGPGSAYFPVVGFSPLGCYILSADTTISPYWPAATGHFALAVGFVLISIITFRRAYAWGEKPVGRKIRILVPQSRKPFRGNNPMRWKEMFSRRRWTWFRIGVAIAATWAPMIAFFATGRWTVVPEMVSGTTVLFLTVALVLVSTRAAWTVTAEVERDCWVTLLSTTLTAREMFVEKAIGAIHSVTSIVLFVVFGWFCCALVVERLIWALVAQLTIFVPACVFYALLGVRFSLRSKSSVIAIGKMLAAILILNVLFPIAAEPVLAWFKVYRDDWSMITCVPFLLATSTEWVTSYSYSYAYRGYVSEVPYAAAITIHVVGAVWLAVRCLWKFDRWTGRIPGLWPFWWRYFPTFAAHRRQIASNVELLLGRLHTRD